MVSLSLSLLFAENHHQPTLTRPYHTLETLGCGCMLKIRFQECGRRREKKEIRAFKSLIAYFCTLFFFLGVENTCIYLSIGYKQEDIHVHTVNTRYAMHVSVNVVHRSVPRYVRCLGALPRIFKRAGMNLTRLPQLPKKKPRRRRYTAPYSLLFRGDFFGGEGASFSESHG